MHQHRITQMVITTTCGTCAATVNTHLVISHLGERHFHTLDTFIVPDHGSPVRTDLFSPGRSGLQPCTVIRPVITTAAIMIIGPWQSLYTLHLCGYIFYTGSQTVAHVGEQVITLIPADLCHINSQSGSKRSMTDITSAFLHLSELAVSTGFQF